MSSCRAHATLPSKRVTRYCIDYEKEGCETSSRSDRKSNEKQEANIHSMPISIVSFGRHNCPRSGSLTDVLWCPGERFATFSGSDVKKGISHVSSSLFVS